MYSKVYAALLWHISCVVPQVDALELILSPLPGPVRAPVEL